MSRRYTKIGMLEKEIDEMIAQGKNHREIEDYYGLEGDRPVHNFLKRRRRKEEKMMAGVEIRPKGRPPKGYKKAGEEKDYEIQQLRMENRLLRDFLQLAGRR